MSNVTMYNILHDAPRYFFLQWPRQVFGYSEHLRRLSAEHQIALATHKVLSDATQSKNDNVRKHANKLLQTALTIAAKNQDLIHTYEFSQKDGPKAYMKLREIIFASFTLSQKNKASLDAYNPIIRAAIAIQKAKQITMRSKNTLTSTPVVGLIKLLRLPITVENQPNYDYLDEYKLEEGPALGAHIKRKN